MFMQVKTLTAFWSTVDRTLMEPRDDLLSTAAHTVGCARCHGRCGAAAIKYCAAVLCCCAVLLCCVVLCFDVAVCWCGLGCWAVALV